MSAPLQGRPASRTTAVVLRVVTLSLAVATSPTESRGQERRPPDARTVPQSGSTEKLSELPEAHIRSVKVAAGTVQATLTFAASPNVAAVVQVAPSPPARDQRQRWDFATPVPGRRAQARPGSGAYELALRDLQPGRRYHYIITVPSRDPLRPWQVVGQFTTEPLVGDVAGEQKLTESVGYHIRNVRVAATATKVEIAFRGRPEQVPIVEISRGAPKKNLDGRLEFRREDLVGGYPMGGSQRTGDYRIEIGSNVALEQGRQYHYVINVTSGSVRLPYQHTGTFTTLSQSVRVVLTRLNIGNDSDGGGSGELGFILWVNHAGRPLNGGRPLSLKTGDSHAISEEIVLENVPDELVIHVDGWDDDSDVATEFEAAWMRFGEVLTEPRWQGPGKNAREEWNVARQLFDLSRFPGTSPRHIPLVLSSMPNGGDKGRLSFTIVGYVEISRQ